MEDVHALSAHGRPIARLRRHLQPGRRLLVLTADGAAPAAIGRCLAERGYGASRIWVLEELGGPGERPSRAPAADLGAARFADLNLMAVELVAEPGPDSRCPRVPGLPDDAFDHDGQLTKAEVRAVTLAALAPLRRRAALGRRRRCRQRRDRVAARGPRHARDRDRARPGPRRAHRRQRRSAWACPSCEVRTGAAPDGAGRPAGRPTRFSSAAACAAPGLLDRCWSSLRPGGRLVANAVTVAGEAALLAFHAAHGGKLLRLGLTRSETHRRPARLAAGPAGHPARGEKAMRRGKLIGARASARATPSC